MKQTLREILNDNTIEFLNCSMCNEQFHKKDGKFLIKGDLIICPYCIEENGTENAPVSMLLG